MICQSQPNYLNYASFRRRHDELLSAGFSIDDGARDGARAVQRRGRFDRRSHRGQVHLIFSTPNALMPQVKAGRLRALGVTSARRLPVIPEVPSIAEAAWRATEVNNCYGILVPRRRRRHRAQAETPTSCAYCGSRIPNPVENLGFDVLGTTPEQFTAFAAQVTWQVGEGLKPPESNAVIGNIS